ncbi:serine/threonine-protein phosphatase 4 regulatory subunit 2-B-like isoform X2 [Watersipora subatra]|uniref:serine/threonine-protein phosphatase 4 regulatory subunit 2-B-like isoform X2 n=1 Tax=Watersipora subatra TaxID=2589382 RepID=UPI00355C1F70
MSDGGKEVLEALQEFKTCFDLAKSSALIRKKNIDGQAGSDNSKTAAVPQLEVPAGINDFLEHVSKTGKISHPWKVVKPLFLYKLDKVMRSYNQKQSFDALPAVPNTAVVSFHQLYTSILQTVDSFKQAPFTIQRLCELVCYPEQHYKRIDKFMNALEKNTLIVTTVDEMGRKLSTASDSDISAVDSQQTEKLLALFDLISSSSTLSNGDSHHPPEDSDKQSTTTSPIKPTDVEELSSLDQTNAKSSISEIDSSGALESADGSPLTPKCPKRSLSEEDINDAEQVSKRLKLEQGKDQQADSTITSNVEDMPITTFDPQQTDADSSEMDCCQSMRYSISHDNDTLTDNSIEELPLDIGSVATSTVEVDKGTPEKNSTEQASIEEGSVEQDITKEGTIEAAQNPTTVISLSEPAPLAAVSCSTDATSNLSCVGDGPPSEADEESADVSQHLSSSENSVDTSEASTAKSDAGTSQDVSNESPDMPAAEAT